MRKLSSIEEPTKLDQLNPKEYIIIKGARVNNLKNLDVAIPRNKLIVITGLSGSGKSSLAFDTLFAEGQRMYVESLSSYARQFLGRMEKPDVDYIQGVSPAIAIEQKANIKNPRSTVGTTTEIYDYLKLLYARIGKTISPISHQEVKRDTVTSVVDYIYKYNDGEKVMIFAPLHIISGRTLKQELNILLSKGFSRIKIGESVLLVEEVLTDIERFGTIEDILILIDRTSVIHDDEDNQYRIADSIQTAFFEGHGSCIVEIIGNESEEFSDRFELDGISFEEPSVNLFSFNNPYGACKKCEGFGKILGIDENLVIPDKSLSVYEGAILPWRSEIMKKWRQKLIDNSLEFNFPIHRPINQLSQEQYRLLWTGNKYFKGIDKFFDYVGSKTHKIQYRVLLSRYRGRTLCPQCQGTRLRRDANYVMINDKSISDLVLMPVSDAYTFFKELKIEGIDEKVSRQLLIEIKNRLEYLELVGLGYLTLNRLTSTLSGGEYQRIRLATSLGSALVGSMYILDEPSIGLHPRDTHRLIDVLKSLRNLGNTVIVVEHEEEVMLNADQIIDIGPEAGAHGGKLIFQGTREQIRNNISTYTARYLNHLDKVEIPEKRRKWNDSIVIKGARENNLKNIDVTIPLGILTVITGVSGSGKSTLVRNILYPAISKHLGTMTDTVGKFDKLEGSVDKILQVEYVDQNPIGKSSRSNPVTYVKAYDAIRKLFSDQQLARQRGYKPSHFSFNIDGGRCEACQGEGIIKIEMQFMADIYLTCDSCKGSRFKNEILNILYKDKNIKDILDLTVDEAIEFFYREASIVSRLKPLKEVGLGYVRLGQSSNSLSGGEAQRVKLAHFLGKGKTSQHDHILFIFDEPTTGLHFHDINTLLISIQSLINQGNSVVMIEHNMEVIKSADWIIDLGPDGGDQQGGYIVFEGTPEDMIKNNTGYTSQYLISKLGN
jgi:excinuclease ABC subunit A